MIGDVSNFFTPPVRCARNDDNRIAGLIEKARYRFLGAGFKILATLVICQ
jgi:hypothetical protein